ncbi:hypothetical protein ZHAS_00009236 [Anopheles sinensis]|uniref:IPT/TIG domain-containing protein n=1 Tax=Anopheles sinensis TaxID=74873 RepID=A0A084VUH5_ANOSI|nr:hypothetical protein ZHAS_00009236 [Anopheles sinensis]
MEQDDEDQQPNRNNVIDLSTAIDGEILEDIASKSTAELVKFITSFSETNIPTSYVPLTYDSGTHLIRVMDFVENIVDVRDRVPHHVQYPIISTQIATHPVIVQVLAVPMKGHIRPHPFYEVFLIPSKHSHACTEDFVDGTRMLCITLTPGMPLRCDFIGIRTVSYEILQTRFPGLSLNAIHKKKTKCFRIAFRAIVCDRLGGAFKLQMRSNMIYYRSKEEAKPVVDMVSHVYSCVHGGLRLMIFGKNFTKEALVIFRFTTLHVAVKPCRKSLKATHLACIVPPFERQDIEKTVAIEVFIQCGTDTNLRKPQRLYVQCELITHLCWRK